MLTPRRGLVPPTGQRGLPTGPSLRRHHLGTRPGLPQRRRPPAPWDSLWGDRGTRRAETPRGASQDPALEGASGTSPSRVLCPHVRPDVLFVTDVSRPLLPALNEARRGRGGPTQRLLHTQPCRLARSGPGDAFHCVNVRAQRHGGPRAAGCGEEPERPLAGGSRRQVPRSHRLCSLRFSGAAREPAACPPCKLCRRGLSSGTRRGARVCWRAVSALRPLPPGLRPCVSARPPVCTHVCVCPR